MQNLIVEKLRRLIAMRDGAAAIGSQAEAATFAETIQRLLSKYKLTLTDVEAKREEESGAIFRTVRTTDWLKDSKRARTYDAKGAIEEWILILARSIATSNDCAILVYEGTNIYQFVGIESDVEQATTMFTYMAGLAWSMGKDAKNNAREFLRNDHRARYGTCTTSDLNQLSKSYRASYLRGFADSIARRVQEQRQEMMTQAATTTNETALVLVDRRALIVKNALTARCVESKKASFAKKEMSVTAYSHGHVDGSRVALTSKVIAGQV